MRRALPILGLWCGLALVLSAVTTRVADWFAMPNELLYERRAISIAHDLSLMPRVRGEVVSTFDQLYPVLVAPAFRWGVMPDDLWAAHGLNAWIMSSACIPAYLLARRVTAVRWVPWAVATLTVVMPWILLSSFLLTEVAAYPAFVWAMLAMQASVAAPSRRHDLLALLAIAIAFFGRTQLALLLGLLPVAIVAVELGRTRSVRRGVVQAVASHRLLGWVYGALAVAGLGLALAGRLPGVLGVYGATIGGTGASVGGRFVPDGIAGSFVEHVATFALGLGILPLVVGVAWLLANLVRPAQNRELHAFACLAALTVAAILLQVTVFDLRFGMRFVHDRYLFYVVPLVVLALFCAVNDRRLPRYSLALPAGLVALGFAVGEIPRFTWAQFPAVDSDGPISALYRPLVRMFGTLGSARVGLITATIALTVAFALAAVYRRRLARTASIAFTLVAIPALTIYMFVRILDVNGWSGRPVTSSPEPAYDWIDRTVGARADVAMAPYPVSDDYFVNQRVWRDYEFWNKSIVRDIQQRDQTFLFTGDTFAKVYPRFDATTGASNVSPARYVLQANQESRFRVAGTVQVQQPDVKLIVAEQPWRLDWRSSGLYADGWTKPDTTARVRVFATPDQPGGVTRTLNVALRAPGDVPERGVRVTSNLERWAGTATPVTVRAPVRVCVPKGGHADVEIAVDGASEIPGDLRDIGLGEASREGGVFVPELALADEIGAPCRPRSSAG